MIIGTTWVTDATTDQHITVDLVEKSAGEKTIYTLMNQDHEIGSVRFTYRKITEEDLATRHHFTEEKVQLVWQGIRYLYYGPVKNGVIADKVYIEWIGASSAKYKGIGTRLLQSVIEKSLLLGCDGRVDLNAAEAFEFYYFNGFRSFDPVINAQLEATFHKFIEEGGKAKLLPYPSNQMYLPKEALPTWKEKILREHILN
jgi:hypothetical protein